MSELLAAQTGPLDPPPSGLAAEADAGAVWTDRYTHAVMDTFGPPQRVLVRGEGANVWDADGRRYLDMLGGIAVNCLGHAHPTLTAAISAQLGTLGHVSNFFASPVQVALAERLLALADAPEGSRVFLANSGTEANEAAFKMARRHNPEGTRTRILALEGSFHGRTMGSLAITSKAAYREPFAPLPGGVEFVPAGDVDALEAAFAASGERGDVAALVLEPIQGESGVRPLPAGYLAAARELTSRYGALLWLDEVQTGMGRTGAWFAHQRLDLGGTGAGSATIRPDVMTLAKGLGGGFPVGAVVAFGEYAAGLLRRGQHGSTFGGNPVAGAAALATIGVIERDGLLDRVESVGARLRAQVEALGSPLVAGTRGAGLLVGIALREPVAADVAARLLDAGVIVNPVAPDTIRLAPPYVLTPDQVDEFVGVLGAVLDAVPTATATTTTTATSTTASKES